MPLTTLYAFQFNGLTFGGANSPYQIQSVDGLEGLPQIRNQDDNRGYADGMFTGQDFLSGRTVTIIFNTFASPGASAQTNLNSIQQKLLPQTTGTTPLYFFLNVGGNEQYISARVRALRTTIDPNYTYGYITSQVEFFCPDPNYYDSTLQTASLVLGGGLGRIYNRTYNLVYTTASAPFTVVNNAGWATTYPTITFNGPITNPIIGNQTQNYYLYFGYAFADTDICVIDLQNKLVTLNGNPARNLILGASQWFSAPPGNNNFYWSGSGTLAGTTSATVTWRNAYI
jgi:phage-related protein